MTEARVPVTVEDREAALAMRHLIAGQLRACGIKITVKPPADDSHEVQAFARHRLAGVAAGREEAAKVASHEAMILAAARGHDDAEGQADRFYTGAIHASRNIATAIRQMVQK